MAFMLRGDRMIVFRYTLMGPISEEYSLGEKLADCGAIVFIESKETTTFGVGIPNSTQEQVLSCLQHNLSQQEYAKIEHALADYEQRLNYYIDALVEQGFPKLDENGKLSENTLKTAEWLVFNEVIGGEYGELWDTLTKMGQDLRPYMGFANKETHDAVMSLTADEIYEYERIAEDYMDKKISREETIRQLAKELKKNRDGSPKINWEQVAENIVDRIFVGPSSKDNELPKVTVNVEYTINKKLNQIERVWTDQAGNRRVDYIDPNTSEGRKVLEAYHILLNKYDELRKKFDKEYNKMSKEERDKFDEWFNKEMVPAILYEFYGGYHPTGPRASEKKQRYVDYIYMYMIANNLKELDERYAQPIFRQAEEYAEILEG